MMPGRLFYLGEKRKGESFCEHLDVENVMEGKEMMMKSI